MLLQKIIKSHRISHFCVHQQLCGVVLNRFTWDPQIETGRKHRISFRGCKLAYSQCRSQAWEGCVRRDMWCKIGTKSRCEWEFFLQGLLIYPAHTLSPAQCACQNCKLPEMLGWQETGGQTHESIWPQLWRQDAIEESRIYFKIWYIKATRCDILSLTVANVCFKVNAVRNIHTLLLVGPHINYQWSFTPSV